MMRTKYNIIHSFILIAGTICLLAFASCKKFLTVSPVGSISTTAAYTNATNIEASVNGIYYTLQQSGTIYNAAFNSYFSLLSDEAMAGNTTSQPTLQFASNEITTDNSYSAGLWNNNYQTIYQANMLLANVPGVNGLDQAKKNQWIGEARFLRAYCYFMLTRYFGKVPLATTPDYAVNNTLSRSDSATVYQFITTELERAATELPAGYSAYNGIRTRVSRQTAQALLARVYLYQGQWDKAESRATSVISDGTFTMPASLDDVVKANSPESIWEIAFSATQNQTATILVPASGSSVLPAVLPSSKLIQSFESGDQRKDKYMAFSATPLPGYNYIYKFRDRTTLADQPKILRLSEMYLIRAEARVQQSNLTGASADINVIRNRAGLGNTPAATKTDLLTAIFQERFVELCFEGHRWQDLIRTGQANAILSVFKGNTWQSTDQLLPVPGVEIGNNPNLNPQNPGY